MKPACWEFPNPPSVICKYVKKLCEVCVIKTSMRDPESREGPGARFCRPFWYLQMASSSESSGTSLSSKSKLVLPLVSDLLDLAIYSFGCQSGLRSNHKVRGDPVVEGVSAFLGECC